MSETKLKMAVKKYLSSIGAFHIKTSDKFTSGIPDIYVIHKGRSVWIELKVKNGILSPIQEWTIRKINDNGGEAYVCHSVSDVREIMEK